jgi:S1-C subfamily serine protease/Tfp pilus assembly protein PilF
MAHDPTRLQEESYSDSEDRIESISPFAVHQPSSAEGAITPHPRVLWAAAGVAIAVAIVVWQGLPSWDRAGPRAHLAPDAIFVRASPAVVQVVVKDARGRTAGTASGFLVSKCGLIATNHHVIEKAHRAHVVLPDMTNVPVDGVVALDQEGDLAIVKVAGRIRAEPLELGGSDLPPVGAKVYAIGNPLGLANTLSDGLVSGHRGTGGGALIQMSAPISPGSSGGPLLGADGTVVGVTTFLFKGGQNLNFAVPASQVTRLLAMSKGRSRLIPLPLVRQPDAVAYVERGNSWLKKGVAHKAIPEFDEAIRLDPRNSDAYACRGHARSQMWDHEKAIDDFNEAIGLDPGNSTAYAGRGEVWTIKSDYDKAFRDLDEAIRLDPQNARAYVNRGRAWLYTMDDRCAMRDLDQAIRLDPGNATAYHLRACIWSSVFNKIRDYDKAIEDSNVAIRLDPDNAQFYAGRGSFWEAKKVYERAISDYTQAIRLDPHSGGGASSSLARLLATCPEVRFRDGRRAVQLASKACEQSEWRNYLEVSILAAAHAEVGQFDQAVHYQTTALRTCDSFAEEALRKNLERYKRRMPYREDP